MFTKAIFATLALCAIAEAISMPIAHHAPQPYKFGYSVKDKHGEQHREEVGNGHSGVKGSYGFTDDRGVQRQVNYVADHAGFRAQVKTNEPGTANQDPAAVNIISSAHPYFGAGYGLGGAGYGGVGYGLGVGLRGVGYGLGDARLGGAGYGLGGAGYGGVGYGLGVGLRGAGYGLGGARLGGAGYGLGGVGFGVAGFGAPAALEYGGSVAGLGLGMEIGLGYGSVSRYDSRYGAY